MIPYYKFHGIDRFYDISGIVHHSEIFQLCTDIFSERYSKLEIDFIAGIDARGFILGAPIALALKKPFVMIRKKGKLPNSVTGSEYFKEYKGGNETGGDELCVSRTVLGLGRRALVIDDLVATGGTLVSACDLLASMGVSVVECACVVELKALDGFRKLNQKHPGTAVWGLISEEILTFDGAALEK